MAVQLVEPLLRPLGNFCGARISDQGTMRRLADVFTEVADQMDLTGGQGEAINHVTAPTQMFMDGRLTPQPARRIGPTAGQAMSKGRASSADLLV